MGLLNAYTDGDVPFNPDEGENPFVIDPTNNPASGTTPVPQTPTTTPWRPGVVPVLGPNGGLYAPGTLPVETQAVTPSPKRGGGGAGIGAAGFGGGNGSFYNFGAVPKFDAPPFVRPDAKSILSAPGYQARLQSGEQALQRSAASKGLLRTGGTLKDLIEYGQNFASNEYQNEFNQALQTYGANHQLAKDKFAPLLAEWDLMSKAEIQRALAAFNRQTIWENPHAGGGGGGGTYDPFPEPSPYGL